MNNITYNDIPQVLSELVDIIKHQSKELQEIKKAITQPKPIKLLNTADVAKLTGRSIHTIHQYTSKGTIPHYKQGRSLYFVESEILDWIKDKSSKSSSYFN